MSKQTIKLIDTAIEQAHRLSKVFCPTGQGGGRDPTCSPGGGRGDGGGNPMVTSTGDEIKVGHTYLDTETGDEFTVEEFHVLVRYEPVTTPFPEKVEKPIVIGTIPGWKGQRWRYPHKLGPLVSKPAKPPKAPKPAKPSKPAKKKPPKKN